jgi:cation diffusion facilitator family transporter
MAMTRKDEHDVKYPIGRSKLEALAVLGCSGIMFVTSVEVIRFAIEDLVAGFTGNVPKLDVGLILWVTMSVGIVMKLLLFIYCRAINRVEKSDALEALAEDHVNDVFSNIGTVVTASVAFEIGSLWWLDAISAIVISLIIVYRWTLMIFDQIRKLVGFEAPAEFVERINSIAEEHHFQAKVDTIRAYHFGARFNVEVDIILPADMTVKESHSIAISLQHKIEELEEVERAFVHVDHESRDVPMHKVERELLQKANAAAAASSEKSDNALTSVLLP